VNNYFADLEGDGSRSAITLMNGLENSPLSGYFHVKDAVIAFNTLVKNKSNLAIGVAESKQNRLPPQDCLIANNIVVGDRAPLVHQLATPIRLRWEGNLMFGAELGIATPAGVAIVDPKLIPGAGGLPRPGEASPALGAAAGAFAAVTHDIDGQPRAGKSDTGCDQRSDRPIVYHPLAPGDVGPAWRR
jgi:poly(beta-D-mannuronate) lyase